MANDDDLAGLSPEERQRRERQRGSGRLPLDQEIARRYDPAALSRLVVDDAGRGEPLEADTRGRMEKTLGGNFRSVRVVRGPVAEEFLKRHRADAATIGGTEMILVKEGPRSNFQTPAGAGLLAHELTHVQQQQRGLQFKGEESGTSSSEQEAQARELQVQGAARGITNEDRRRTRQVWMTFWKTVIDKVVERVDGEKDADAQRSGNPTSGQRG